MRSACDSAWPGDDASRGRKRKNQRLLSTEPWFEKGSNERVGVATAVSRKRGGEDIQGGGRAAGVGRNTRIPNGGKTRTPVSSVVLNKAI